MSEQKPMFFVLRTYNRHDENRNSTPIIMTNRPYSYYHHKTRGIFCDIGRASPHSAAFPVQSFPVQRYLLRGNRILSLLPEFLFLSPGLSLKLLLLNNMSQVLDIPRQHRQSNVALKSEYPMVGTHIQSVIL